MRAILVLVLAMWMCHTSWGQTPNRHRAPDSLSPSAEIYLMTIAPGEELYSTFAHSAIWVSDRRQRFERVYNYGVFDFNNVSPATFYTNFTLGKMRYRLDTESWDYFQRVYHYFERSYTAQRFQLTHQQKNQVFRFLEHNYLPENRTYWYDFLWDNCATRIRDLLQHEFEAELVWDQPHEPTDQTYRDLLHEYLTESPWAEFGIDLALGAVVDQPSTPWTQTFLPDYLAQVLAQAQIKDHTGMHPLVDVSQPMYLGKDAHPPASWITYPITWLGVLALVVLGVALLRWKQPLTYLWADRAFFFVVGLAGTILLFLWVGTEHSTTKNNFNILWLIPSHLVMAWTLRPAVSNGVRWYWLISTLITASVLGGWFFWPQAFNPAFIPLILIIVIRSVRLISTWYRPPA